MWNNFTFSQTEKQAEQFLKSQPPVYFKENKGQVSDQNFQPRPDVLYYGSDGAMNFHMRKDGISYQLTRVDSWKQMGEHLGMLDKSKNGINQSSKKVPNQQTVYRVDVNWLGANPAVETQTGKAIQGVENYYTTVCPDGVLGVRSFESVQFTNLYEGIDLKYYEHDGHLKYDYLVAPGSDYKQIKLEYKGATSLFIDKEGKLLVETPLGTLYEPLPMVTQNGQQLEANWKIKGEVVSFEIENYNPAQPMIIDPLVRVWGTYYGGEGDEISFADTGIDEFGNVYMTGSTNSVNAISSGGFQNILSGDFDAFLVKFDEDGNRIWATYFGGFDNEEASSVSIDFNNNIYLAGTTQSTSNIGFSGFQNGFNGAADAFLIKFNQNGNRIWATYYGGNEWESGTCTRADNVGNVYLSGVTLSSSQIAFMGFQNNLNGVVDNFLVKFDGNGNRIWGTYYGGSEWEDHSFITSDQSGNIYLCGSTNSLDQISNGGFQSVFGGGYSDAYFVKFDSAGNRIWSTYYGGNGTDYGYGLSISLSGKICLIGSTNSLNQIASGGLQNSYGGGLEDGFVAKFDENGNRIWSTFYGGDNTDWGRSISIDPFENIYLAGITLSSNLNISGGFQNVFGGGDSDVFIVKFDEYGNQFWSTYYGGENSEGGNSIILGSSGDIYFAGYTSSLTQIASNGYQNNIGSVVDNFLVKMVQQCDNIPQITGNSELCYGENSLLTSSLAVSYLWSNGETTSSIDVNSAGEYHVTITDSNGCIGMSIPFTISMYNSSVSVSANTTILLGEESQLFASGGETYAWQPPTGLSCTDCPNPIVQPEVPTQYTVTVTDSNGCVNTKTVFVNIKTDGCIYIPNIFSPNKDAQNDEFCLYGSCLKSGTFTIYNRWGDKVFETTDMKQCWDGTYKGVPVGSDVFFYKLNGVLVTGEVVEESGNIEVVK